MSKLLELLQYLLVVAGKLPIDPEISWAAFCMFYTFFLFLHICVGEISSREFELREQVQLKVWMKDLPLCLGRFGSRIFFCSWAILSSSDIALCGIGCFLIPKSSKKLLFRVRIICVFLVLQLSFYPLYKLIFNHPIHTSAIRQSPHIHGFWAPASLLYAKWRSWVALLDGSPTQESVSGGSRFSIYFELAG